MQDTVRERALTSAMEKYKDSLFRLAISCLKRRADAEDALQEVFISYYRHAPEFESEEHEKAWLVRVTVNRCISMLRSPWCRLARPLPDAAAVQEAEEEWVIVLVRRLPAKYAAVIHLHYYEDMPVRQIAETLNVAPGTVQSRLARGRERLKKMIENEKKKEESIHAEG